MTKQEKDVYKLLKGRKIRKKTWHRNKFFVPKRIDRKTKIMYGVGFFVYYINREKIVQTYKTPFFPLDLGKRTNHIFGWEYVNE
jgi:hypothetical protein